MTRPVARLGALVALVGAAVFVTACSSAPQGAPEPTQTVSAEPVSPPEPSADASPAAPTAGDDPTCETIIPAATVEALEDVGWTSRAQPFFIGNTELIGGIQCVWGDFTTATDHVQVYGWAPISASVADDVAQELVTEGWIRESAEQGFIITESENTALATDADGYGLSYLFGDGWVKYADTKQGLLLVIWQN